MAPPKKKNPKTVVVSTRLTAAEHLAHKLLAKKLHMSMSDLIRVKLGLTEPE